MNVDQNQLGRGRPAVERVLVLGASAARHAAWWLCWQTRTRAGDDCRSLGESGLAPDGGAGLRAVE